MRRERIYSSSQSFLSLFFFNSFWTSHSAAQGGAAEGLLTDGQTPRHPDQPVGDENPDLKLRALNAAAGLRKGTAYLKKGNGVPYAMLVFEIFLDLFKWVLGGFCLTIFVRWDEFWRFPVKNAVLLLSLSLSLSAAPAHAGFLSDLKKGYQNQAQSFSDQTLIDQLNHPTYSWLWMTPTHVTEEVARRAGSSQEKASALVILLANKLVDSSPAAAYVIDVFKDLAAKAQVKKGMSFEALLAIYEATNSNDQAVRFYAIEFLDKDLKLNLNALTEAEKLMALEMTLRSSSYSCACGYGYTYEASLIESLKRAETSEATVLAASAYLSSLAKNSAKRAEVIAYRASLLESHIDTSKKAAILKRSLEMLAFINDKESYAIHKIDIELLEKYAPKEMLTQVKDQMIRILNLLENLDKEQAKLLAQMMVKNNLIGAGGSSGGSTSAGGSAGAGIGSGVGSATIFGEASRQYANGQISSAEMKQYLENLMKAKDLSKSFLLFSDHIEAACLTAGQKRDQDVADYCINTMVPELAKVGKLKNHFELKARVASLIKNLMLKLASYWDQKSFEVSCRETNYLIEFKRYLDIVKTFEGQTFDYSFNEQVFKLTFKVCASEEMQKVGIKQFPNGKHDMPYEFWENYVYETSIVDSKNKTITFCFNPSEKNFRDENQSVVSAKNSAKSVQESVYGVANKSSYYNRSIRYLLMSLRSQLTHKYLLTDREVLFKEKALGVYEKSEYDLDQEDQVLNVAYLEGRKDNGALTYFCAKSKNANSCGQKSRAGSYSCDRSSSFDLGIKYTKSHLDR